MAPHRLPFPTGDLHRLDLVLLRLLPDRVYEVISHCRGIALLAWPFRWRIADVVWFNAAIAAIGASLPWIQGQVITAMSRGEPIDDVLFLIALCVFFFWIPHTGLLPYWRDLYETKYVRAPLRTYILEYSACQIFGAENAMRITRDAINRDEAHPVLERGQKAVTELVTMLGRDTVFALRGAIVLLCLFKIAPGIGLTVIGGIVLDVMITSYMGRKLTGRCDWYNHTPQHEGGIRINLLREHLGVALPEGERQRILRVMSKLCSDQERAHIAYAQGYFLCSHMGRGSVSRIAQGLVWAVAAWYVSTGQFDIGDFVWLAGWAAQADDPVVVYRGFHKAFMDERVPLGRFFRFVGIDEAVREATVRRRLPRRQQVGV